MLYPSEALYHCTKLNCVVQLRYLQTLSSIAAENNSTIVFPVPIGNSLTIRVQSGRSLVVHLVC